MFPAAFSSLTSTVILVLRKPEWGRGCEKYFSRLVSDYALHGFAPDGRLDDSRTISAHHPTPGITSMCFSCFVGDNVGSISEMYSEVGKIWGWGRILGSALDRSSAYWFLDGFWRGWCLWLWVDFGYGWRDTIWGVYVSYTFIGFDWFKLHGSSFLYTVVHNAHFWSDTKWQTSHRLHS